ncbi:MAG: hypothetical protein ACKVOU_11150 [Cytophagales bacterium]
MKKRLAITLTLVFFGVCLLFAADEAPVCDVCLDPDFVASEGYTDFDECSIAECLEVPINTSVWVLLASGMAILGFLYITTANTGKK